MTTRQVETRRLIPGDQVKLCNGMVRTVDRVVPMMWINRKTGQTTQARGIVGDRPLYVVYYVETGDPADIRWGNGNSSSDTGLWDVVIPAACVCGHPETDHILDDATRIAWCSECAMFRCRCEYTPAA